MRGVDAVADVVKPTLGAAGSNVILEAGVAPGHMVTNDGVSIAQMVRMTDPVENIGANLIKEIASRSDKESGDGTTTSTVLAQAILHAGINVPGNPMDIKRSLDECLPLIYASIDEQRRDIGPEDIRPVAVVSGESEELGEMFEAMYKEIGKDGIVELDTSNLPDTYYTITEGVRLRNAGWLGAYSSTEPGKAVYKNPHILISRDAIRTEADIMPIVTALAQKGINELVLFCDEIDMGIASKLAYNHLNGKFRSLIIKAPTLWKDWITEDFARITGATVVDAAAGVTFKTLTMEHLGTCEKIITTRDETRVIGIKDITEYLKELNERGDDDSKLRASWLQTKVATLRLGASSDTELSYKRLKAEDARGATYLALQDGIVPGGGVALVNAVPKLPDTVGGRLLRTALGAPMRQIIENAGGTHEQKKEADARGFNAKTGEWVDMWDAGIVDPARVVKNAIKNAVSVAGTVLTAQGVIVIPQDVKNEAARQMPGMQ